MRGFGIFNSQNIPEVMTSQASTNLPISMKPDPSLGGMDSARGSHIDQGRSKTLRPNFQKPDSRLKEMHMDSLTATLRKASVDYHMEWIEKLIKNVHEDMCHESFREALSFIKSLHGDLNDQEVPNRLGLAKVGVLELRTDFNADHRSQFLELFKKRLENDLDFVCVELSSLEMTEDAVGVMARKQRMLDRVIEEIISKCTHRLTYVLDRPFHKSSTEARKHFATYGKKSKTKKRNSEDDIYTELGLESVHPSSMLSKHSRTSLTKRGAPGSRSNPIHPSLDHFFMKFERNGLPKRIALLISNADSALPSLLQEMLHTLQLYTEHCGLQLVVLLPRASASSLPVLSVNQEFVILKEVNLPTCAKLGMQILYTIETSPAQQAPMLLCDKAFSQLASFFTHYYGSLRGFRTQLKAFITEAIQQNALFYLYTIQAIGVPDYILLSEFKALPKLMTAELGYLLSARPHSRSSMKLPPEIGESKFNSAALHRQFEGAARKKDEWINVLKWIEAKWMQKFQSFLREDQVLIDKQLMKLYKELSVPQEAGVEQIHHTKEQKELIKFFVRQKKLRAQSKLKDKILECFSKTMQQPSKTLYQLFIEHNDKQLQEQVRKLVLDLREELNLPDEALKLEEMMETRLKELNTKKKSPKTDRALSIISKSERKQKPKEDRDVVETLSIAELKKVLKQWCDIFMKTQFAWWERRPHPSPDHPYHSFLCVGSDSYIAEQANVDLAERYISYCESVQNSHDKLVDIMRRMQVLRDDCSIHQFQNSDGIQLDMIETMENLHAEQRLQMSKNQLRVLFMKAVFLLKQSGFLRSDGKIPSVARMMLFRQKHISSEAIFAPEPQKR